MSVLLALALLATIGAIVVSSGMSARRSSHLALERAEANALAEAGINDAILSLLAREPGRQHRVDGTVYTLTFAGARISVSIQDENGRIDLNNADRELLVRLFTSVGMAQEEAAALSDRIQDWRASGTGRHVDGTADADYRAAGYEYGPRNAPFQTIDELKLVLGMNDDLFRKVEPALTVYSHRASVNRLTAPREILVALSPTNGADVDRFTAERAVSSGNSIVGGILAPSVALADWAFTIRAELVMPSGATRGREAVVRFTDDPRRPYWIQAWRELPD